MTLEDFFTLTEMKDGLTAPARVEELIAVMKKEKDCAVKNIGDATRQWSAVSSTIAATDNKDCLDIFIQLDGLWFIDRWLKDAQKFDTNTSESFVEEAITAMLGALEKLHIDNHRSTSSGIWNTVKNLIGHSSPRIQDRARALCDRWKQGETDNTIRQDAERVGVSHDNHHAKYSVESGKAELSPVDITPLKECAKEENCSVEPMRDEVLPSKSSGGLQAESIEDAQSRNHKNQEKMSTREEPPVSTVEGAGSIESCASAPEQQSVGQIDAPNFAESTKDTNNIPGKSAVGELYVGSSLLESRGVHLGINVANAPESVGEPTLQSNGGANEVEGVTMKSEPKIRVDDMGIPNYGNTWSSKNTSQKAENCTVLQESPCKEHTSPMPMDAEASFPKTENCGSPLRDESSTHFDSVALDVLMKMKMEDSGSAYEEKEHVSDADKDLACAPKLTKPKKRAKSPDFLNNRISNYTKPVKDSRGPDMEFEYGIVDALEVARQVAQEVEREVVDYREPSCSSSEKDREGGIAQPSSPDSINSKEDQPISAHPEESPGRQNLSSEEYLQGESSSKSDYVDTQPESYLPDMESSQVTEAAQEPEANSERGGMCGFDLNQEVCSDDMDRPVNAISTLISVVSASRPAVSPGLPAAPLQFEGTLGWKGSALTSAFRPASPRRISDGGGSSNGSKSRQDRLDIDLNVAEDGDDKFGDLTSGKQIHASFGFPSGESSVEISSRKSERLKLDLNCMGDDGDAPSSDFRMDGQLFHHQNGRHSPSPASSSSSMQPSMRNFDLNDGPFHQNDSSEQGHYHAKPLHNLNAYGDTKPEDPVISIMGTRVEVKRKDFVPQTISLSNGRAPEFAMDANVARTAAFLGMGPPVSYAHPPYGYNGLNSGPAMSFSSSMYGAGGSIPYMVDSRGAPVVPQVVGSGSAVPPYSTQQPFIMSMTSPPLGLNGIGPSRPNFDLNTGFVIDGGGNRESSSFRQFFVPSQNRSMEEHLRNNSLPSSSVVGAKRKEPDAGWELYPFNYKNQQPPWK